MENKKSIPQVLVEKEYIVNWNTLRQQKEEVKNIFNLQGNKFSFIKSSNNIHLLHIYLACDDSNNLYFYFISAKDDSEHKFDWAYASQVSVEKLTLPENTRPHENEFDNLGWETANKWVENWIDDGKRNSWIINEFSTSISENDIVQAFQIDISDFDADTVHNCFLALKEIDSDSYKADLIIYNTVTHRIVNVNGLKTIGDNITHPYDLHDLARPVPPFGNGARQEDFGILVSLGIL